MTLEQGALGALHPAPAAGAWHCDALAVGAGNGGAFIGFDHVEAVLALGKAGSGAIDAPGQRVECRRGRLRFAPRPPDPGREGRRRGRPVPGAESTAEPIGEVAVSKSAGDVRVPAGRRGAARGRRRGRDEIAPSSAGRSVQEVLV